MTTRMSSTNQQRRPTYDELDQAITKILKENDNVQSLEDQIRTNHNDWIVSEKRIERLISNKPPTLENVKVYYGSHDDSNNTTTNTTIRTTATTETVPWKNPRRNDYHLATETRDDNEYDDYHYNDEEVPQFSYEEMEGSHLLHAINTRIANSSSNGIGCCEWCPTPFFRMFWYAFLFLLSFFFVRMIMMMNSIRKGGGGSLYDQGGDEGVAHYGDNYPLWFFDAFLLFLWMIVFSFLWHVYTIVG